MSLYTLAILLFAAMSMMVMPARVRETAAATVWKGR